MTDLAITNGRVVTPHGVFYGGVAIEGGKIAEVSSNQNLSQAKRVLDAQGNYVIPGLIDAHVHLGDWTMKTLEEGFRAQFQKETDGALHGGVTSFGHMLIPSPKESNLSHLDTMIAVGNELSYIDYFCHAVVISELHLEEQPELWRRGVTSFKHFFNAYKGKEGMGILNPTDEGTAFQSLGFIARQGHPGIGMFHCEEMDVFYILAERLQKTGRNDLKAWAEARPAWIETMRMIHALELAKGAGAPIYIVHMSCAEAVDIVAEARRHGYRIWGETAPHYLTHTAEMEEIGCWGKVNTSLKYKKDNDRLWRGILDGGVTNIGTDHSPDTLQTKEEFLGGKGKYNNIWKAVPGICGGMEHMLPVMMTHGVNPGRISIEDLVRVCSTNNARVFGLPYKGILALGYDADLVLIDPDKEVTIDKDFYHGMGEWSIYLGWRVKGMARTTILRGEIVMEDYQTVGKPGYGQFIPCRAY